MKADRNVRNARLLIALYWIHKVINGGSIPKTTLKAVMMEKRSAESAHHEKEPADPAQRTPRRKSMAAGAVSVPVRRILRIFLRKQKVLRSCSGGRLLRIPGAVLLRRGAKA